MSWWLPLMLTAVCVCLALGVWQLERATLKAELLAERSRSGSAEAWTSLRIVTLADAYQRVRLRGVFLNQYSFFLDNRTRDGKAGFEVIVPFRDAKSERTVLVNRGWMPFAGDRAQLPQIPAVTGEQEILAEVYGSPRPLLGSLPESLAVARGRTPVVPYVQADIVSRYFGLDLEPAVLRLRAGSPAALRLDWPRQQMGPARHRGYALQWFSLALMFALLTGLAVRKQRREAANS